MSEALFEVTFSNQGFDGTQLRGRAGSTPIAMAPSKPDDCESERTDSVFRETCQESLRGELLDSLGVWRLPCGGKLGLAAIGGAAFFCAYVLASGDLIAGEGCHGDSYGQWG